MAKLLANPRPVKRKPDTRTFTGTCSNCREKKVRVVKVQGAQVCTARCLGGNSSSAISSPSLAQIAQELLGL